jgi:excinuclease UvrABC helicase subunit UvrB
MNDIFKDLFDSFFNMNDFNGYNSYPKDNDPNFNKTVEEIENGTHVIKIETWKSLDGSKVYKRTSMVSKEKPDLSESRKKQLLDSLQKDLDLAVENQEFEKAAELRDQINNLKSNG